MAFEQSMQDVHAVLSLSAPGVAPLGLQTQGMATFNRLWTAMQVPCISMPALWGEGGLPMGLQLIHRRYEDHRLLEVAACLAPLLDLRKNSWN
jgi:Asp-tRNA(Asn)/Glu-tRNA(Gln) amidotransferase A subunit family amidase